MTLSVYGLFRRAVPTPADFLAKTVLFCQKSAGVRKKLRPAGTKADKEWVVDKRAVVLVLRQRRRPKVGPFAVKPYSPKVVQRQHRLKVVVVRRA